MFEKIIEKISFPIIMLLGLLIGISSSNIFHFAIEDNFETNIIPNFLFGKEYALSQALLIVSSVFFILLSLIFLKFDKQIFILTNAKKNLLIFFLVSCIIAIFIYICIVVYSVFAGQSEPYGLLRIGTTFIIIFFGILALILRLNNEGFFFNKKIFICDLLLVSILLSSSIYLTLKFASPSFIKKITQDKEKVNNIKFLSERINDFYIKNKKLPNNINDLDSRGYIKDNNLNKADYNITSDAQNRYTICSVFSHNSDEYKRHKLRYDAYNSLVYKKGLYCFNYEITKREYEKDYKNIFLSGYLK